RSVVSTSRVRRMSPDAPHALFLRHPVKPGKRDELVEVWRRHMPEAIEANDGHEAYVYCASHADRDVLVVYQQYRDAAAAQAFLEDARDLLAGPPEVEAVEPLWSKAVGPTR